VEKRTGGPHLAPKHLSKGANLQRTEGGSYERPTKRYIEGQGKESRVDHFVLLKDWGGESGRTVVLFTGSLDGKVENPEKNGSLRKRGLKTPTIVHVGGKEVAKTTPTTIGINR